MEPIDAAADQLATLISDVAGYLDTVKSEQDTRLKVINRMLTEVLGWPLAAIHTEEPSASGFVDYKLSIEGLARLVVEAKRDGRDLGLSGRQAGRSFKLSGPVFNQPTAKEGIEQGIRYCGQKNAELACVSNGREWIVFRGSRLGDGRDTFDGMAFVFPSLIDVQHEFKRFYDLLSYDSVREFLYRIMFQEAEGRPIRSHQVRKPLRTPQSRRFLQQDPLATDIDRVMTSFFRRLSGDDDPDMILKCFVVTKESSI